ncbi:hypothetical protein V8F06_008382 [Rhypophila decipiens]
MPATFSNVSDATEVKIEPPRAVTATIVHISSFLTYFPSIVSRNMWLKHKGTSLPVLILSNVIPVRPVLADSHVRCHIKTPWETPEPLQKSVLECFYNNRLRPSLAHSQSPMPPKSAQNGDRRARLPTSATTFGLRRSHNELQLAAELLPFVEECPVRIRRSCWPDKGLLTYKIGQNQPSDVFVLRDDHPSLSTICETKREM